MGLGLSACSGYSVSQKSESGFSSHAPSSLEDQSCLGLVGPLLNGASEAPEMALKDLPAINLTEVKANAKFKKIAELNPNLENREKSYYIMAYLKKDMPGASDDQLLKKYRELFRSCD